jgi:flagellar L-ring protein precursor FlgH
MNYRKVFLIIIGLLLLPFTIRVMGADFGQAQSLFTDIKAHSVGDVLTVLIYEQSQASQQIKSKNEKTASGSTSGGPGFGPLRFIPLFGVDLKAKNSHDGKGENSRNGSLRARMSVTVIGVKPNGDLIIQGSRTIGISSDRESLALSGVVRQKDVTPENTIDSYLIADAEISYTGKGSAETASRQGFVGRLLNWLF